MQNPRRSVITRRPGAWHSDDAWGVQDVAREETPRRTLVAGRLGRGCTEPRDRVLPASACLQVPRGPSWGPNSTPHVRLPTSERVTRRRLTARPRFSAVKSYSGGRCETKTSTWLLPTVMTGSDFGGEPAGGGGAVGATIFCSFPQFPSLRFPQACSSRRRPTSTEIPELGPVRTTSAVDALGFPPPPPSLRTSGLSV